MQINKPFISKKKKKGKLKEWKKGKTYEEAYGEEKAKEIKNKFSNKRKGKERGWKNTTPEETGKKISESLKNKNITRTKEQREKLSDTLKEFFKSEKGIISRNKISENRKNKKLSKETKEKQRLSMKGRIPKKLDVHPSSKIWCFYDKNNKLILETIGNLSETLIKLEINWRMIKKFNKLEDCLKYELNGNIKYKVYYQKYYQKI
jgi:hypothetical protein